LELIRSFSKVVVAIIENIYLSRGKIRRTFLIVIVENKVDNKVVFFVFIVGIRLSIVTINTKVTISTNIAIRLIRILFSRYSSIRVVNLVYNRDFSSNRNKKYGIEDYRTEQA